MINTLITSGLKAAVLGLGATLIVGCATSEPTIDTSADESKMSFDGMYPVKGGRMDGAWARKDFNLESYSKVVLQGVGVEYRPGGSSNRRYNSTGPDGHYELTDEQKEKFQAEMADAFREELAKGQNFEIVEKGGPDVLLVRGALLDVVSFVPADPVGNADIYINRVGEVTLVLELRDSVSNAILLRAVDRRAAEDTARGFTHSNSVSTKAEVRRLARTWGQILREALDRYMVAGDEAGE